MRRSIRSMICSFRLGQCRFDCVNLERFSASVMRSACWVKSLRGIMIEWMLSTKQSKQRGSSMNSSWVYSIRQYGQMNVFFISSKRLVDAKSRAIEVWRGLSVGYFVRARPLSLIAIGVLWCYRVGRWWRRNSCHSCSRVITGAVSSFHCLDFVYD